MPTYEMICNNCNLEVDLWMSISRFENEEHTCKECAGTLNRHYRTATNFSIPGSCTYDGKLKVSGGTGKEEPMVPINIIDEKPGGGYTVQRIANKKDQDLD